MKTLVKMNNNRFLKPMLRCAALFVLIFQSINGFAQTENGFWGAYDTAGNSLLKNEYRKIEFNNDCIWAYLG